MEEQVVKTKEPKKIISYSGVVLDEKSKERLIKRVEKLIPEDWKIIGDHMTISLGEIPTHLERYLGMKIPLDVESFAINDRVCAVGVSGFETKNRNPHITIAVNEKVGATPKESNNLENWEEFKKPLRVSGYVKEIPFNIPRVKKISFYDFDSTLIHSPEPERGKVQWEKVKGVEYPHIGWWSKPESLDLDVFKIKPIQSVVRLMKKDINDSDTLVVVLTSRLDKLKNEVKNVLDHMGLYPDIYDLKKDNKSKGEKVLDYIKEYPTVEKIYVYDDNYEREITSYKSIIDQISDNIEYMIYYVDGNNIKQIN